MFKSTGKVGSLPICHVIIAAFFCQSFGFMMIVCVAYVGKQAKTFEANMTMEEVSDVCVSVSDVCVIVCVMCNCATKCLRSLCVMCCCAK